MHRQGWGALAAQRSSPDGASWGCDRGWMMDRSEAGLGELSCPKSGARGLGILACPHLGSALMEERGALEQTFSWGSVINQESVCA